MCTGYLIDPTEKEVREVHFEALADMQALINGKIAWGYGWPNGDTLYIDDEGMDKHPRRFFALPTCSPDQGFAGNGLVVGPEVQDGAVVTTLAPRMSLGDLEALVYWIALG
jgi:hypothetical protein